MTAVAATFADFRPVKSRGVYQIILEVPAERANDALIALGGLPLFGSEQWVGVAPLVGKPQAEPQPASPPPPPSPEKVPHKSSKLSVEAFWMCRRRDFQEWLGVTGEDAADARVKSLIRIMSKTALDHNRDAAQRWRDLVDEFHRATMPQEPAA